MKIDEENVITELGKRNTEVLEFIMNNYARDVYYLVRSIIKDAGSKEDVEECVSEVFSSIWARHADYSPERGNLKTWILIIAKYKALDYRRKIANINKHFSGRDIELVCVSSAEDKVLAYAGEEEIIQAINTLKEPDKEIFYRRYFFYESIERIAEHFNMTREAIDNRLSRGRKKLREILLSYNREEVI